MRCKVCKDKFIAKYFNQKACSKECKKIFDEDNPKKEKECKKCKIIKTTTEFFKNGKGGFRGKCKSCERNNKVFRPISCEFCSVEFTPKNKLTKYCSRVCGSKSYNLSISKKPKSKKCKACENSFKPYTSLDKYCSSECRVNNQKSKRKFNWSKDRVEKWTGKNNPSYRNGMYSKGSEKNQIGLKEFHRNKKEIKNEMINEDGFIYCQHCKTSNSLKFETHHIIFRSEKPLHENLHKKENLIHLCISCHNNFHKNKSIRNKLVEFRGLNRLFGEDVLNK